MLLTRKANPDSQAIAADCHVSIAAEIKRFVAGGTRQILVTSAGPGEGKSSVLCEVGRALARQPELRVVLVDADQLRPAVHQLFKVDAANGLGELIERTYATDLGGKVPAEFGLGDWIELLQVQGRTGRLEVLEDGRTLLLTLIKGAIVSIQDGAAGAERRLGGLLTEAGHLTTAQRDQALKIAAESGEPLGEIALRMGFVEPEKLQVALRSQFGERLQQMLSMHQPHCRYTEATERELGVASRDAAAAAGWAKQPGAMLMIRERLKQPYLTRQLSAALKSTDAANLKLVTAGGTNSNLLEGVAPAALRCILDHLSVMFDVVLVDSPPVALGSPAESIGEMVGGTILVVQADRFEAAVIRRAKDRLEKRGARLLGVILNQVDLLESDQSFHYYYLYYPTGKEGESRAREARRRSRLTEAESEELPTPFRARREQAVMLEFIGAGRKGGRVLPLVLVLSVILGALLALRFGPWSQARSSVGGTAAGESDASRGTVAPGSLRPASSRSAVPVPGDSLATAAAPGESVAARVTTPGAGTLAGPSTQAKTVAVSASHGVHASPSRPDQRFTISVGSFLERDRADAERRKLLDVTQLTSSVQKVSVGDDRTYRVLVGSFASRAAAVTAADGLIQTGKVREALVLPVTGAASN